MAHEITETYLASGWCNRCGGKLDGYRDCANCDRWYNHPVLTFGSAIIASFVLLTWIGIRTIRNSDPGFARLENSLVATVTPRAFTPVGMPMTAVPTTAPVYFHAAAAPVVVASTISGKSKVPVLEAQLADLESLRQTVHATERAYVTGVLPASSGVGRENYTALASSAERVSSDAVVPR